MSDQSGMISEEMIRARMAEEIADLRAEVGRLHKAHQTACEGGDLLCAEIKRLIRERDEALEEIRCLGGSEVLAKHSGSPSREWHSAGAWLYPGETIHHVIRSPREEPEVKP